MRVRILHFTRWVYLDSTNTLYTVSEVSARKMIMIKAVHSILGDIYFWVFSEDILVPAAEI